MTNEELSDTDLFNEAMNDGETVETQVEQPEQVQETETQAVQETEPTQEQRQQVDDNAAQVPSWRVREINEEKRQLADRVRALEAERVSWQANQQRQQPQEREQQKPVKVDPLLDPDGYAKQVREDIRNEILAERREESLQTAAEKYGDEFKEAYTAAQQKIDPALRARMQASRDPGETLIKWHRENKQRAEIGDDLAAYKQRLRDEALKDPEFRKAAMEAWRNEGQQSQQVNGRPNVQLPPSLSSASRSNAAIRNENAQDVSDRELFQQIAG